MFFFLEYRIFGMISHEYNWAVVWSGWMMQSAHSAWHSRNVVVFVVVPVTRPIEYLANLIVSFFIPIKRNCCYALSNCKISLRRWEWKITSIWALFTRAALCVGFCLCLCVTADCLLMLHTCVLKYLLSSSFLTPDIEQLYLSLQFRVLLFVHVASWY